MVFVTDFKVVAPHVRNSVDHIEADFEYTRSVVAVGPAGCAEVRPVQEAYVFRTEKAVGRVGVMMVGWGGNNGSTVTAGIIANRENLTWRTKEGVQTPNYHGSIVKASTVRIGTDETGESVYVPLSNMLPMVDPNDLVLGGWDINGDNMAVAMRKAQVLDVNLQDKVEPFLEGMCPLPAVFYPGFVAENQADRANNVVPGDDKEAHVQHIRDDIRKFKADNNLDKVIVMWTANTERFVDEIAGVNDTADNLLASIDTSHPEVSPSTLYAVASILEGSPYINGSPQNTFVPGCIQLAERKGVFIGGDDFKSGQTKFKSVLVDFLVNAGIKPTSIISYNHLGNNDGKNLSAPSQFRSKEKSKSNVVDDMVRSNPILYPKGSKGPDHVVVIKYVPNVGDSKRAMDEYTSDIFLGGKSTIVTHNTCEDSLLACPLIIDLVVLTELSTRIKYRRSTMGSFAHFHPVLSLLSYMLKAPMVPKGMPVVNSLFKQRAAIENVLRACVGLPPETDMRLEHRAVQPRGAVRKNGISNGNGHGEHK